MVLKNRIRFFALLLIFIVAIVPLSLVGCDKENVDTGDSEQTEEVQAENFTVTFDSDGGTEIKSIVIRKGEKISKPENPLKTTSSVDYAFDGWYNGDVLWDFEKDSVDKDITLKAKWKVESSYSKEFTYGGI